MAEKRSNWLLDFLSMQVEVDKQILEMFMAVTDIFDEDIRESLELLDEIAEKLENTKREWIESQQEVGEDRFETSLSYR